MKTQLLCTFVDKQEVHTLLNTIIHNFEIIYNKIFVLSTNSKKEVICSYNINSTPNIQFLKDTISVHRKKDFNVMYTINALNEIIRIDNNGYLDKTYQVDWSKYRDSLLVTDQENKLKRIDTKIFFIHTISN